MNHKELYDRTVRHMKEYCEATFESCTFCGKVCTLGGEPTSVRLRCGHYSHYMCNTLAIVSTSNDMIYCPRCNETKANNRGIITPRKQQPNARTITLGPVTVPELYESPFRSLKDAVMVAKRVKFGYTPELKPGHYQCMQLLNVTAVFVPPGTGIPRVKYLSRGATAYEHMNMLMEVKSSDKLTNVYIAVTALALIKLRVCKEGVYPVTCPLTTTCIQTYDTIVRSATTNKK